MDRRIDHRTRMWVLLAISKWYHKLIAAISSHFHKWVVQTSNITENDLRTLLKNALVKASRHLSQCFYVWFVWDLNLDSDLLIIEHRFHLGTGNVIRILYSATHQRIEVGSFIKFCFRDDRIMCPLCFISNVLVKTINQLALTSLYQSLWNLYWNRLEFVFHYWL